MIAFCDAMCVFVVCEVLVQMKVCIVAFNFSL